MATIFSVDNDDTSASDCHWANVEVLDNFVDFLVAVNTSNVEIHDLSGHIHNGVVTGSLLDVFLRILFLFCLLLFLLFVDANFAFSVALLSIDDVSTGASTASTAAADAESAARQRRSFAQHPFGAHSRITRRIGCGSSIASSTKTKTRGRGN